MSEPDRSVASSPRAIATALVVEDEPLIRMLLVDILEDLEIAVLEAGDAASAVDILNGDEPIDLLITDIGLPGGMDGWSLVGAARERRPELAIIVATGNTLSRPTDFPADGRVIGKPFRPDELTGMIRQLEVAAVRV